MSWHSSFYQPGGMVYEARRRARHNSAQGAAEVVVDSARMDDQLRRRATALIDIAESDRAQQRLSRGFETDFCESVIDQWHDRQSLTERQVEVLEQILERRRLL